jgi:hypothetical protein
MKIFKAVLLSAVLFVGSLAHVSAPALASPQCTAPNGCSVGTISAGQGLVETGAASAPVISVQNNPDFSNLGTLTVDGLLVNGLAGNNCIVTDGNSNLITRSWPCTPATHSFVIPAIGSTVTVQTSTLSFTFYAGQKVNILDGTNNIEGTVVSSITNSNTFNLLVTSII